VIDTDIQSPGIHVLFGLPGDEITSSLNDYLWGDREIGQAARDVTPQGNGGRIFLIPSSTKPGEISRALREGYDAQRLTRGLRRLVDELELDVLLIDTHPGLHEETLLSLVISNTLLIVMRPDQQDYEGTGITVRVAQGLEVPRMMLLVNKTPESLDAEAVKAKVEAAYGCDVVTVMPHSDDLMTLASAGIFVLRYPEHPLTALYETVADSVSSG
jgi:septum site-determining protein MinD